MKNKYTEPFDYTEDLRKIHESAREMTLQSDFTVDNIRRKAIAGGHFCAWTIAVIKVLDAKQKAESNNVIHAEIKKSAGIDSTSAVDDSEAELAGILDVTGQNEEQIKQFQNVMEAQN